MGSTGIPPTQVGVRPQARQPQGSSLRTTAESSGVK